MLEATERIGRMEPGQVNGVEINGQRIDRMDKMEPDIGKGGYVASRDRPGPVRYWNGLVSLALYEFVSEGLGFEGNCEWHDFFGFSTVRHYQKNGGCNQETGARGTTSNRKSYGWCAHDSMWRHGAWIGCQRVMGSV
jgi:hypothetical protein